MSEEPEFSWVEVHSIEEMTAFFLSKLPAIRAVARELGYGIGQHGSLKRDFDLMAMPWREDHATKDELAAAIQKAACGIVNEKYSWTKKPCGRTATSFPICWPEWENCHGIISLGCLDLSIMPGHSE